MFSERKVYTTRKFDSPENVTDRVFEMNILKRLNLHEIGEDGQFTTNFLESWVYHIRYMSHIIPTTGSFFEHNFWKWCL